MKASPLYSGGDLAMINQNHLIHFFYTTNKTSNEKIMDFIFVIY